MYQSKKYSISVEINETTSVTYPTSAFIQTWSQKCDLPIVHG